LTHTAGNADTGTVYFDGLRVVKKAEATGIENIVSSKNPDIFYINQNYPNPFNPETDISFGIPTTQKVRIRVYNLLGQVVESLMDEIKPAGNYTIRFNGNDLSSGVYLYQIEAGSFVKTNKMLLIK